MKLKSKIKLFLLVFSALSAGVFSIFASDIKPVLEIPQDLGRVKEFFDAEPDRYSAKPLIIHIQDAHCNYEAQKNMAQILDYLVKEKDLSLIMVEGGSGDVGLSFLRNYSDKAKRLEVAEQYLRKGEISGEEYLDIVSDHDLELWGIEDQDLYDANLDSFLDLDSAREQAQQDLEKISQTVEILKQQVYSRELKDLEANSKAYEKQSLSLTDYCLYLRDLAENKDCDLSGYFHFNAFLNSVLLEKELDFSKAETERNLFIRDLAKILSKSGVQDLIAKTKQFKTGALADLDYYSYLETTAENKLDLNTEYPQLHSYISYLSLSRDIDVPSLVKELSGIKDRVQILLMTTQEQRKLNSVNKNMNVLRKFLSIALPPEEYAYFQAHKSECLTSDWAVFLSSLCRKYRIDQNLSASSAIDGNLDRFDAFYCLGKDREKAFLNNMEKKLEQTGETIAVLITGGFHTPGITAMLKKKGYPYAVVAPVITERQDSEKYFSILKNRN